MNYINLQPNVSPHEQISGMKLGAKRDLRVAFGGDYVLATNAETDISIEPRAK